MRKELIDLIERMSLQEDYKNSKNTISWLAHREAEKLTDLSIIEELQEYLSENPIKRKRSRAYFIIGKIGKNTESYKCAEILIGCISGEKDKNCLATLLDLLGDIPKRRETDISPVLPLLSDPRWLIRHGAILSLKNTCDPIVEIRLIDILRDTEDSYDMMYCNETLRRIGTRKAISILEQELKSRKRDVRITAKLAIDEIIKRETKE
jgi:hypothetical protein